MGRLCIALLLFVTVWTSPASAKEKVVEQNVDQRLQPSRLFAAARVDIGFVYFRPRLSLGYGQPFWKWVGIDANPIVSAEGVGVYGGIRAALPNINLRAGARWQPLTFERSLLTPKRSYVRDDIETRDGPKSKYVSLESELTVSFKLGGGDVFSEFALTYVTGVQSGFYVYEETIRVVVEPPWVWRGRVGYSLRFLKDDALRIGGVLEVVAVPGRTDHFFALRGGIVASLRIRRDLQIRALLVPVLVSRDTLGSDGGDVFLIGIRHYWATGRRR